MRSPGEILDTAVIAELRALSTPSDDLLSEVRAIFERDGAALRDAIRAAAARGDPQTMWKAAHEMRSVASNAGAVRVAAICDVIQEEGLAGRVRDIDDLDRALVEACAALRRL